MIKVTIGFCVKNAESLLQDAVHNIVHQDFPDERMEVIMVDGSSTDRTVTLFEDAIKATTLNYAIFQENEGLGVARQIV
ncbi:glycosyltransferase, partial [Candidatus Bathyarchaeota archaeon]|nr:glycosyltransferase [Candidatus Bathyarchaeota archaeon]